MLELMLEGGFASRDCLVSVASMERLRTRDIKLAISGG